ncbi:hypothetical protein [Halorubrum sp. CBA1229]|uniref:hypothetical protein n=1 Tax=Halorubrum sp. CBA1229 TaxID=1853699 RepID=UPI000F3F04CA|nr:hypothetical protein [Halorubrum sp. CBA1229]QKY17735.1 hypothetical protein Hrr1229_012870 [Halorubrum sp. CBA1229]
MSDEEKSDDALEVSSPSNSSELDDKLDIEELNVGQNFAHDLAALSEAFQKIQETQIATIADSFQSFEAIQKAQVAEFAKSFQSAQAIQQAEIAKLIESVHTVQKIQQAQIIPIAEQLQELSRIQAEMAFADFPDEVFTTAIAASTVSGRTRTNPSSPTTLSTSTSDPSIDVESASNPSSVNNEHTWSLYLEAAVTLGMYLSYKMEGLDQSQREAAATLFTGAIVFGATPYLPVSETPLVAGSAASTFTLAALNLRSNEEGE